MAEVSTPKDEYPFGVATSPIDKSYIESCYDFDSSIQVHENRAQRL